MEVRKLNPNPKVTLSAKLEWYNPWGSVKDRAAMWMIVEAERRGELKRGDRVIIEPTSGNTGIALAGVAKYLGYDVRVVVPKRASDETKRALKEFGAAVMEADDDLCPRVGKGTDQAISLAQAFVKSYRGKFFMPNQYENFDNVRAHYQGTGPEIWRQTQGSVTHFVVGVGTGGTIVGVGKYLKEKNPDVRIIGVQPEAGHHIQGLRNLKESMVPKILESNMDLVDEWITVSDRDAFQTTEKLNEVEGLPAGPSSGAALFATWQVLGDLERGCVVTVFPDGRDRHLSTIDEMRGLWSRTS